MGHGNTTAVSPPTLGHVPLGETINLVDPPSDAYTLFIIIGVFLFLSTLFCGLRFYTRVYIAPVIGPEDYTILAAYGLLVAMSGVGIDQTKYGLGVHSWNVPISNGRPFFIVGTIFHTGAMLTET